MIAIFILLSAILSALILHYSIPWFRHYLLDLPNLRSSHYTPTPRGGGVVFVLLSSITCIPSFFDQLSPTILFIPLTLLPLAIVGLIDDKYDLPSLWRYLCQIFSSVLLLWFSPLIVFRSFSFSLTDTLYLLFILFVVISITAIINFVNFMDGIDGLVAGCMVVALFAVCIYLNLPLPFWVLIGALLGFLFLNWSPSRIFMGDVGSTFLGAIYAGLVLQSPNWSNALAMLLVITPLIGDSFSCVLLRLYHRQSIFKAHRVHLYQRLNQAGFSHSFVSSTYIFFTIILSFAFVFGGLAFVLPISLLVIVAGFLLDRFLAVPFAVSMRC